MSEDDSEIFHYESQLAQVQMAIATLPDGPEKNNLYTLEADLKELIILSKNSKLESVESNKSKDDPLFEEYNLFKAELAQLDDIASEKDKSTSVPKTSDCSVEIKEKLVNECNNLQGTKCQAPFMYKWASDVTYHNAIISHIPDLQHANSSEEVEVKVMFTNPTHKEMMPCPYYLEGDCKFSDEKCRYSHGELVLLSSLKEYREPIFSELSSGSQVFAKQSDGLWYRAFVLSVNNIYCQVKFESNSKEESIPLHNILPLDCSKDKEDVVSDSDSEFEDNEFKDEDTVKSIFSNIPGSPLGEWEKFTKGFGSRIMAKMGYIHGSGLGKDGIGRVEPVSAVVLPAGKSLDHCMMLKKKAGNDQNLFKAERKLKLLQRKHEEKLKNAYENEKKKTDVFTFLNTQLDFVKKEYSEKMKIKKPLKNESTRTLNVTCLQLSEEMRKVEKEIKCLNQSLARHSNHSHTFNIIKEKLINKENKLSELVATERKIRNEQYERKDREKLTVF